MGKAAKGAGKAAAKAAKKVKQEKLAERRATKQAKGGKGGKAKHGQIDHMAEDDLDALLEQYRTEWETQHATAEEKVGILPSRRANATLTPCPLGNDLWLYGGEYYDGDQCVFFQDLFRYIPEKNEWRSYACGTQPGPRSAHQMVGTPVGGGQLWCFGGEFASAKQTSFHHYRDLWVYSIAERVWEKVETKVRPSGRSGHRMALWKHFLVLFGGFVDTGVRTSYLQDLWVFDTLEYKWHEIKQNDLRRPGARSGFSFLATPEGVVLYGGYCKKYIKGQRTQGVALDDAWMLQMDEDLTKIQWTKRRKIGYAPNPARSGCTMALWGNRMTGILFGGVTDTENDEESLESTFHNALYGYQLAGNGRWISLNLRKQKKKAAMDEDEDPRSMLPLERYNAMLAVQRNTLYIYGGIFEKGDREYTLDDFYTLDLSKMNQVVCLKECPIDNLEWHSSEDEDSSDDDEDDDESESESEPEEQEGVEDQMETDEEELLDVADLALDDLTPEEAHAQLERQQALRQQATAFIGVTKEANRTEEDILSTPMPGEILQTFYLRTKHYWASLAHVQSEGSSRGKQLRRDGFDIERIRTEAEGDFDEGSGHARRPTGPGTESRHRR